MTGGFEAVGDIATGALIGRAVEKRAGEVVPGVSGHGICLNCGMALIGDYCHVCGQSEHVHRTLGSIGHDLMHGVFHFEGKIWRTLPMLAWHPGVLTRRYIAGERARFISPLALFLFSVFLMFAVFETVGGPVRDAANFNRDGVKLSTADVDRELATAQETLATLQAERGRIVAQKGSTEAIDAKIEDAGDDISGLTTAQKVMHGTDLGEVAEMASKPGAHQVDTGYPALDERIEHALDNPKLLLYKVQAKAYKFAWALIPLSIPFLWAMFAWRRRFKIYDHAVFITYSLSAVILLLIAMALVASLGVSTGWAFLLVPVHFYRQLREAYGLRRFSAAWRTIGLLFSAAIALFIFLVLLIGFGLMG